MDDPVELDGPPDVALDAGGVVEEVADPELKVEGRLFHVDPPPDRAPFGGLLYAVDLLPHGPGGNSIETILACVLA